MKVITLVGTSLFRDYQNKSKVISDYPSLTRDYENITTQYDNLIAPLNDKGEKESIPASEYKNSRYQADIEHIREVIQYLWLAEAQEKSCAELQTLYKSIQEAEAEAFEVYLLATDTLLSVLAAELIKEYLVEKKTIHTKKVRCVFNNDINSADTSIVRGLSVTTPDSTRLIERIKSKGSDTIIIAGIEATIASRLVRALKEVTFYDDSGTF